jgi:HD-GYP domain-containing protein (c-di-GMP phosphodiesterase class II)
MIGALWLLSPVFALLAAVPVVIASFSIETFVRIQREPRTAMLEMRESIDLRDPATLNHSARVARLSVALAQQLNLPHEQVANIELSAQMHDIGQIGIDSMILMEPTSKLTPEEQTQVEVHPVIGYEMLGHDKDFRPSLAIVRSHHERCDERS